MRGRERGPLRAQAGPPEGLTSSWRPAWPPRTSSSSPLRDAGICEERGEESVATRAVRGARQRHCRFRMVGCIYYLGGGQQGVSQQRVRKQVLFCCNHTHDSTGNLTGSNCQKRYAKMTLRKLDPKKGLGGMHSWGGNATMMQNTSFTGNTETEHQYSCLWTCRGM